MSRTKESKTIIHIPSTLDIYYSMASCIDWVELLLLGDHPYNAFVEGLLNNIFFKHEGKRTTIKRLSTEFGIPTTKITRWIVEMYEDLFSLNWDKPELFRKEGIKHTLHFQNYDIHSSLIYWLNTTPRENESFSSYFLNAKMGIRCFWVTRVQHVFEEGEHCIDVFLKGGFPNQYKSLLLDRAMFFGHISHMDTFTDYDFQIDDKLKAIFKSERF